LPHGGYTGLLCEVTTQSDEPSPLWRRRLISELSAADEHATALAGALTPQQLNWSPRPGVWSVGQCLEHLCVSNEEYLKPMADSLEQRQPAVVEQITPGWFGRWFIRNCIEPSRGRRRRAPKKIRPLEQGWRFCRSTSEGTSCNPNTSENRRVSLSVNDR